MKTNSYKIYSENISKGKKLNNHFFKIKNIENKVIDNEINYNLTDNEINYSTEPFDDDTAIIVNPSKWQEIIEAEREREKARKALAEEAAKKAEELSKKKAEEEARRKAEEERLRKEEEERKRKEQEAFEAEKKLMPEGIRLIRKQE